MLKQTAVKQIKVANEKQISFRGLVPEIPSTTYGTFGLYRYPAKFIPQIIAATFKEYSKPKMKILDPFAGCGTTGLVARMYGLDYELWDLNPMLKLLHSIAITNPVDIKIDDIIKEAAASQYKFVPSWNRISYWFPEKVLPFLFSIWGYYHSLDNPEVKKILLVPLLKTTRLFSYNDPQRQKLSKSPIASRRVDLLLSSDWKSKFFKSFSSEIASVLNKINEYQKLLLTSNISQATIRAGLDATDYIPKTNGHVENWDMLITSPPYLQAQEYIRNSKLDLFWIGYPEEAIKQFSRKELPYKDVASVPIYSKTYLRFHKMITEPHMKKMFERYFYSILGTLTNLSFAVNKYMFLLVGSASVRSVAIPIDRILAEHFTELGWRHELTLVDSIPSRVMFQSKKNPATGLKDKRILKEKLVILKNTHNNL